jgi:murein DD-endopeptidase MepM/ murein hydrolase activator NlpD
MNIRLSAPLALLLISSAGAAADIRLVPDDMIIAQPANPNRGYMDLVVHAIAVRADAGETLDVDYLTVELMNAGQSLLTETVSGAQIVRRTGQLMEAPVPMMIAGQLLDRGGLGGLFGRPTLAADATRMAPNHALVSSRHYYAVQGEVDSVRVTLHARDSSGGAVTAQHSVPVSLHRSPIEYRPPVSGAWLMQAVPTLQSHHRLNPSTEFAVDFFKVDAEGRQFQGDPLVAEQFYGYGADVLAAADGEVVAVTDGEVQDRAAMVRRPDETPQAAGERISSYNMRRMAANFERAAAGNLVVIRHDRDGATEYSAYGHLRSGIPVSVGERVIQGQVIGQVGDTGDSAAVHLHFQVNAGPDPFATRSLPARMFGLRNVGGNSELGRFVSAESAPAPTP